MAREEQSALLCLLLHLKYPQLGRQEVALSALRCIKVLESGVEGHVFGQNDDQKMTFLVISSASLWFGPEKIQLFLSARRDRGSCSRCDSDAQTSQTTCFCVSERMPESVSVPLNT